MKKALCWLLCGLSNIAILYLCIQLVDFSNKFAIMILVLAPVIFSLPWIVILGSDR